MFDLMDAIDVSAAALEVQNLALHVEEQNEGAVALYRGALPALEELALDGSPAFGVVKAIVYQALAWSRASST